MAAVSDGPHSASYQYLENAPLVAQITFATDGQTVMTTSKEYDALNRLTAIASHPGGTPSAASVSFAYNYNAANQRIRRAESDSSYWSYQYDALGQVISGKKYWADATPVAGQQFEYAFDDIGNRRTNGFGGNEAGLSLRESRYTVNHLNQYTSRTVPGYVNILGEATNTASVSVNTNLAYRKGRYFRAELSVNNTANPVWLGITNLAVMPVGGGNYVVSNVTGRVFVPKTPESFGYDADGNMTNDGRWVFGWDSAHEIEHCAGACLQRDGALCIARTRRRDRIISRAKESRPLKVESRADTPLASRRKVEWQYDALGRRIRQTMCDGSSGTWQVTEDLKFVSDGWRCIAELDTSHSALRTYIWGLDLSGTLDGAGGVGGLLAVHDSSTLNNQPSTHFVCYDGNGNVVALVNAADGTETARYEYGPFAEPLRVSGPMAKANPIRFSTQYADDVTGDLKYLFRDYDSSTGRWPSRDPLGELGGANLYGFVRNSPLNRADPLGLRDDPGPTTPPCFPGCPICSPPSEPPTGKPGYHDFPYWFDHPVDEGKPCCCEPPAKLKKFERTDDPPTRTRLSLKIDVQLEGCYKDLAIVWWTCWRPDGSGGYMPGFNNQTSASLDVYGITIPGIGDLSTGPHITQARIRYLSCEKGKWVKHVDSRGRTYVWHDGQWTW